MDLPSKVTDVVHRVTVELITIIAGVGTPFLVLIQSNAIKAL